jgi:uncharacterized protein (DUF1501 family)
MNTKKKKSKEKREKLMRYSERKIIIDKLNTLETKEEKIAYLITEHWDNEMKERDWDGRLARYLSDMISYFEDKNTIWFTKETLQKELEGVINYDN